MSEAPRPSVGCEPCGSSPRSWHPSRATEPARAGRGRRHLADPVRPRPGRPAACGPRDRACRVLPLGRDVVLRGGDRPPRAAGGYPAEGVSPGRVVRRAGACRLGRRSSSPGTHRPCQARGGGQRWAVGSFSSPSPNGRCADAAGRGADRRRLDHHGRPLPDTSDGERERERPEPRTSVAPSVMPPDPGDTPRSTSR